MTKLRFLGDVSLLGGLGLALLAGALCYWLYRQETLRNGMAYGRLLPWLRSIAVALIVLMLTGPTLQHRRQEGMPSQLTIVIDDSASMGLSDGKQDNRIARAIDGLLRRDAEFLPKLAEWFDVDVVRASDRQPDKLWSSSVRQQSELPESSASWLPSELGLATALGETLDQDQSAVLVLLSDGRVNQGSSLTEAAQRLPFGQRRIFAVGFGESQAAADLAIVDAEHPDRVFRRDALTGKLILRDTMPAGKVVRLQAWHGETLAWEQRLTTDGSGQRMIAFSFPIEKLVDASSRSTSKTSAPINVERSAVPLDLQFRIADLGEDANADNDSRSISLWADLHRSRVLLIDGRSRWETRYLKNMFERDPYWELNAVIAEPVEIIGGIGKLPVGKSLGEFPDSRDAVMEYDLVLIGEVNPQALSPLQQSWLVDFVAESGGGLIVIDGRRNAWLAPELGTLTSLLPVRRLPLDAEGSQPFLACQLTSMGRSLTSLNLDDVERQNAEEKWKSLPAIQWSANSEVVPGSEVLATSSRTSADPDAGSPLLVTRLHGAGRVFYSASDELWRWRYKVADQIHTRLWNQIARWVMRTPYVVKSDFVSLDAGRMNYEPDQPVEIRCRLKRDEATPLIGADVEAVIRRHGKEVLAVSLTADPDVPGVYRGTAANLSPGEYAVSLSASGVPRDALAVQTQFVVSQQESEEFREQTCDIDNLRRVAELTGGKYLAENEMASLLDQLTPLSQGRIIETETILWQSFAWFIPVVACLSIEWWLRKRVGLV